MEEIDNQDKKKLEGILSLKAASISALLIADHVREACMNLMETVVNPSIHRKMALFSSHANAHHNTSNPRIPSAKVLHGDNPSGIYKFLQHVTGM